MYETPDGRRVRYEWRTLESWYYLYKARGLTALQPRQRKDAGVCRAVAAETAKYLLDLRRRGRLAGLDPILGCLGAVRNEGMAGSAVLLHHLEEVAAGQALVGIELRTMGWQHDVYRLRFF